MGSVIRFIISKVADPFFSIAEASLIINSCLYYISSQDEKDYLPWFILIAYSGGMLIAFYVIKFQKRVSISCFSNTLLIISFIIIVGSAIATIQLDKDPDEIVHKYAVYIFLSPLFFCGFRTVWSSPKLAEPGNKDYFLITAMYYGLYSVDLTQNSTEPSFQKVALLLGILIVLEAFNILHILLTYKPNFNDRYSLDSKSSKVYDDRIKPHKVVQYESSKLPGLLKWYLITLFMTQYFFHSQKHKSYATICYIVRVLSSTLSIGLIKLKDFFPSIIIKRGNKNSENHFIVIYTGLRMGAL